MVLSQLGRTAELAENHGAFIEVQDAGAVHNPPKSGGDELVHQLIGARGDRVKLPERQCMERRHAASHFVPVDSRFRLAVACDLVPRRSLYGSLVPAGRPAFPRIEAKLSRQLCLNSGG